MSKLEAIRHQIRIATGLDDNRVIYQNQSAPRPQQPYITVLVTTDARVGEAERLAIDDDGIATLREAVELSLSIQSHGEDAVSLLRALRTHLYKISTMDALASEGVVYRRDEGIQDLAELRDREFEQRALYDAFFGVVELTEDDVGVIEEVVMDGNPKPPGS